jgi:ABC-type antimicrobial peptide transport system permease subunit
VRTFISSNGVRIFSRIQGVSPSFENIYSWNYLKGSAIESPAGESVVLGANLAADLFGPDANPIGQVVQLRATNYIVVGVTDDSADDHSEVMFVPWLTLQGNLEKTNLDSIIVSVQRAGEASSIAEEIRALLRQRHGLIDTNNSEVRTGYLTQQGGAGGVPDDFTVETQAAEVLTKGLYTPAAAFALANLPKLDQVTLEEMTDTLDRASGTMTALLASIAGASLFVGGIGIMNIMLVSITERTREIGLRMASGARDTDVTRQFLIEAITLSSVGGLIGLGVGLLAAKLVSVSLGWPATVTFSSMVLAIFIAASVGLVFGYYPARRAAELNPIDALRTE